MLRMLFSIYVLEEEEMSSKNTIAQEITKSVKR